MNPEQLLIPRYKVIADYPDSKFVIGDMLFMYKYKSSESMYTYVTNPESALNGTSLKPEYVEKMSHLFKPLQWWQDRKREDLSGYIKRMTDGVWDVYQINIQNKDDMSWKFGMISNKEFLPATESEYLSYINSK